MPLLILRPLRGLRGHICYTSHILASQMSMFMPHYFEFFKWPHPHAIEQSLFKSRKNIIFDLVFSESSEADIMADKDKKANLTNSF